MSSEREPNASRLISIHIDLTERSIQLTAEDQRATKLTLTPEGVIYEATERPPHLSAPTADTLVEALEHGDEPEREPTVRLSGRLKSQPREGRTDGSGNPTAWARFAAHEEGAKDAHLYLATFHRHTRAIALVLPLNAPLTVDGYPHEGPCEGRLDTLSVVNIVHYPGKPKRATP